MPSSFVPGPDTKRDFRDVLGCFSTGVTVVTVPTEAGPLGMTVNSFASVSLDPPLILWSLAKSSHRYAPFFQADRFAVHVLAADQRAYASHFADHGNGFERFAWAKNAQGVPILKDCLALFECQVENRHSAGDHTIIVARVSSAMRRAGTALVFEQGQYGAFSNPE